MNSKDEDLADPILYRTYYKLVLGDILDFLGFPATQGNKRTLHDFHKRITGYKSIAGKSQRTVSNFILEVVIFWQTEFGIFIRTSAKQEKDLMDKPLSEVWNQL